MILKKKIHQVGNWEGLSISVEQPQVEPALLKEQGIELGMENGIGENRNALLCDGRF